MTILYGIKNCDTIKKARAWLDKHNVDYVFHDYKKDGVDDTLLLNWCNELGFENLLNKRGTTWRKLPEDIKDSISEQTALATMLKNPSIIKRPLLVTEKSKLIGFSEEKYSALFK